jgi:phosphohistidine phosphatase
MRVLTIVRHAKSSWDYSELSDFERPLNDRGRRDAPAMAQRLARLPPRPDRLLSSPAVRALTTATLFAEALGFRFEDIAVNARIYDASLGTLLKVVAGLDDDDRHVVLFGHNPGVSELAHALGPCDFDELPTCGVARFEFATKSWHDVDAGQGRLVHYIFPKDGS